MAANIPVLPGTIIQEFCFLISYLFSLNFYLFTTTCTGGTIPIVQLTL